MGNIKYRFVLGGLSFLLGVTCFGQENVSEPNCIVRNEFVADSILPLNLSISSSLLMALSKSL